MSDPRLRSSAYESPFYIITSLPERLSFPNEQKGLKWIGSDATLDNWPVVDHADETFTAFSTVEYYDYLSELTGLRRGI